MTTLRGLHDAATLGVSLGSQSQVLHRRPHPFCYGGVRSKESVVVITGATGTGKSKLSIDVASRFPSEVVNADKMQVYRGLDITTNKMPLSQRRGVPHHLLGELDPAEGELFPAGFRSLAGHTITGIVSRRRLPVVAGGSNSFLHALVANQYDPRSDPFAASAAAGFRQYRLRYRCCFLWVDVEAGLLEEYLDKRVDDIVAAGMVEEMEAYFAEEGDGYAERHPGMGKAIGLPEFRGYFRRGKGLRTAAEYGRAVAAIKENTRRLAEEQVRKIRRLKKLGWDIQRVDATETVRARMKTAGAAAEGEAWKRDVLRPSMEAIRHFLAEEGEDVRDMFPLAVASG